MPAPRSLKPTPLSCACCSHCTMDRHRRPRPRVDRGLLLPLLSPWRLHRAPGQGHQPQAWPVRAHGPNVCGVCQQEGLSRGGLGFKLCWSNGVECVCLLMWPTAQQGEQQQHDWLTAACLCVACVNGLARPGSGSVWYSVAAAGGPHAVPAGAAVRGAAG